MLIIILFLSQLVCRDLVHYELSMDDAENLPMGFVQTMAERAVGGACKGQIEVHWRR